MTTALSFREPARLSQHFSIPLDVSPWKGPVGTYNSCLDSKGKQIGFTPARERATFGSLSQSLQATTSVGRLLSKAYGVYLLAFDLPFPALYVGIAASSSKSPEGVLSRIQKHRVKLTASHIGSSATTHGGVNHTGGWREFAIQRASYFCDQGIADCVPDARLVVGEFTPSGGLHTHKSEAEWFEGQLTGDERLKRYLMRLLWPAEELSRYVLLTTGCNSGLRPESPSVTFWDESSHPL